jgi:hypothetical protein
VITEPSVTSSWCMSEMTRSPPGRSTELGVTAGTLRRPAHVGHEGPTPLASARPMLDADSIAGLRVEHGGGQGLEGGRDAVGAFGREPVKDRLAVQGTKQQVGGQVGVGVRSLARDERAEMRMPEPLDRSIAGFVGRAFPVALHRCRRAG